MFLTNEYLNTALRDYEKLLESCRREFDSLPEGNLSSRKTDGKTFYVHEYKSDDSTGRCRRHIVAADDLTRQLARKKYLEKFIPQLSKETDRLQKFIAGRSDVDPAQIIDSMKGVYSTLPEEYFFGGHIRDTEKWAQAPYHMSNYKPDEKKQTTSRGLHVRSKSELLIAEKLYEFNIPFRYEEVIMIAGRQYAPDFKILKKSGKLVYWEHLGLMENQDYRYKNKVKLTIYERAGIMPWRNLIVTYDEYDGGINLAVIESEIRSKLLD